MSDNKLLVWNETRHSLDGKEYGVRLLLSETEAKYMQAIGILGELTQIIGMQPVADQQMLEFEKSAYVTNRGMLV